MIRVGVIGYGYWGPNIVRNFQENPHAHVEMVCDQNPARLNEARKRYPHLVVTPNPADLLKASTIDLLAITTPVTTHAELVRASIVAGKHVLVAKPLAKTAEQAEKLVALADRHHRILAVDHTFVYSPAVQKIQEIVAGGEMGEIYYYDSTRVNLGLIQSDVNVIWDLAAHDLSILDFIFRAKPVSISARAIPHVGTHETVAYLFIKFSDAMVAHLNVNWLAPRKVRTVYLGGSRKMIVYDDNEPSEKVKVYDRGALLTDGADRRTLLIQYRTGDMVAPQIPSTEALQIECQHLIGCIHKGVTPITGGIHAITIVRLLEAAEQSIREGSREVPV